MNKKASKKFSIKQGIAIFLAATFFFVIGNGASASLTNNSDNITDLQERRRGVQANIDEQVALLAQARAERNDIIAELIELDIELAEVTYDYYEAVDNLEIVTQLLHFSQQSLAEAERQREAQFEMLRLRLRSLHENSPLGYIELLLSSGSIADFLNNMEHFSRILEHDNTMLDALMETEARVTRITQETAQRHGEVQALTLELEHRINVLEATLYVHGMRVEELEADEASHQAMINQLDADRQQLNLQILNAQAQADAARARQQSANAQTTRNVTLSADAVFLWPVQGRREISSGYGWRTHPISRRNEFHEGIDMRAPNGTPILAAEEGFVSFAGWMSGYGNTIIIDHGLDGNGNRVTTLYAHNSRNIAQQGQWVERGDHIANVGSTGFSTGPHLHFEVRLNGQHTDPGPYLGLN